MMNVLPLENVTPVRRKRSRSTTMWSVSQIRKQCKQRIEGKTAEKNKGRLGRKTADFGVFNRHVACNSMQGLIRSARGADGPTQRYLCMHVCARSYFMPPWGCNLFIYLFGMEADVEASTFNLIIYPDTIRQTEFPQKDLPDTTHKQAEGWKIRRTH